MSIVLRLEKGSPLTTQEMDNNFRELDERISSMEGSAYGVCTTAANEQIKEVYFSSEPRSIRVKFTYSNIANSPKLKVGSQEAYPIYYRGDAVKASILAANAILDFQLENGYWNIISSISTTTSYPSKASFPNIGVDGFIYIAEDEAASYSWNADLLRYVCLGRDYTKINVVNGDIE